MKARLRLLAIGVAALMTTGSAVAQLRLPDPKEALSSPGMEKMAGILFSRRLESDFSIAGKILPSDDPRCRKVQAVVDRLARSVAMDRPGVVFQVKLIDDDEVNAFCIPGGYIYVYTGLLDHIDRHHPDDVENATAVVLSHEIAHAVLRHGLKEWAASKDFQNVLKDEATFRKMLLAYSRSQEFEADRYGALYAVRAGFRFSSSIDVFRAFPDYRHIFSGNEPGSHPTGAERVAQLEKYKKQLETLMAMWDESLLAADSDRLDQASIALEILEAEFPNLPSVHNNLGWVDYRLYEKTDTTPGPQVASYTYVKDMGIRIRGLGGDTWALKEAQEQFRVALSLNPDLVEALEGSALCSLELGQVAQAEQFLTSAVKLAPRRAETQNLLGILAARKGDAESARGMYRGVIALNASYAPAYYNLGLITEGAEREKALKTFLTHQPSGYWAQQAQSMLGHAPGPAEARPVEMAGVRLGSTEESVISHLGQPQSRTELPSDTVALDFGASKPRVWLRPTEGVSAIEILSGEFSGVTVGDSSQVLRKALGEPSAKRPGVDGEEAWIYPDLALTVLLREDRVHGLRLAR